MLKKLKPTIAIIDSGIGGISILKSLIKVFKAGNFIYFADNLYMPYGMRSKRFVHNRVDYLIHMLREKYQADIIIIACNTASSAINYKDYENVYAMQFNDNSTYLATFLTKKNKPNLDVIADKSLAKLIEKNIFDKSEIDKIIKLHINKYHLNELKEIVLGCTHYELVADIFKKYCPNTNIIKNSEYMLKNIIYEPRDNFITIKFLMSKDSESYYTKLLKLIGR